MTRAVFRNISLFFLMILIFSGCAALPVRGSAAPPPQPAPPRPPAGAALHYSMAVLQALNDNMGEAIREMEEARRLDPSSPYLAKEIASFYAEKGETAKALAICRETLAQYPDDIDNLLLLGGLYLNLKDYRSAAGAYRRVVELDRQNITARFYLGTSHAELKQFEEAIAEFRALIGIDPNHFMANYYLARILADLERYDEAEEGFKKTAALRPEFESAMIDLAQLYERQKKISQAIEIYKKINEAFPTGIQSRIKLGELFLRQERYD